MPSQTSKAEPDELSVGDYVRWDSSGGTAQGRIVRIERDGQIDVPDSDFTINGDEDDPAALIRVYDGDNPTDVLVGHRFSELRKISPLKSDINSWEFKATQDEVDERYSEYHKTVNMSASELERWSESECSKLASVDRSPIKRNLNLLRTPKSEWGDAEYKSAGRTISFVSRMRGAEQGEPASDGCPSKRDISLRNWAFNPSKSKSETMQKNEINSLYAYKEPTHKKSFAFHVKEISPVDEVNKVATIKGYGAVFNNVDLGNDLIPKGAFKKTLSDKGNKVYFLADHQYNLDNFLGVATVEEDEVGLIGEYEINLDTQKGREAYSQAKQAQRHGIPLGMSIGFDIMSDEMDKKTQVRLLKEIRLHEISLTMFPMNPKARVTSAKSVTFQELLEIKDLIDSLVSKESSGDTQPEQAEQKTIEQLTQFIKNERQKLHY